MTDTEAEQSKPSGRSLEARARKAATNSACVQLDMCKAAVKAGNFGAARAALALADAAIETLDPQPDGEHG